MNITTEHLVKKYGDTLAVDDLSISIKSGQLAALLGPSGCGKSTILNMISGILPVTGGKIYFDDKDITDLPPEKRNVGLVFQNYALYPHMTVLENICFPLKIKHVKKQERIQRAEQLAEMVRIQDLLKRKPSALSGGQQQRVAIARALAKNPEVLLLDEPLSNLDAKLRVEMREEIRRIQRESKITTVFVTHDQEEASSIADQIILLNFGKLQQQDSARKLYDDPSNFFVADFLGAPPINKLYGTIHDNKFFFKNSEISYDLPLRRDVADETKAVLAVRAESVVVPVNGQMLSTVVNERYTINKDELSVLEVAGQTMRGFIDSDYPINVGEKLDISLKRKGVFLFDEETGERLS